MKLQRVEISLSPLPRSWTHDNSIQIERFVASLPPETAWLGQALHSLLVEDRGMYPYMHSNPITNISLTSDGVLIGFDEYDPINRKTVKETKQFHLTQLRDYTYEANGFRRPNQNDPNYLEYPKWDLLVQAVKQDEGKTRARYNRRVLDETRWGGGPI